MIHAEEENPDRKINAGDGDIPPIPFAEAIDFLKARVPITKKEWEKLEPKLRFRAFTVAKLSEPDVINKAKSILVKALENGGSYASTWEDLKNRIEVNAFGITPNYWETVFRTNTQTAYMAGKLQQYERFSNIVAYQLLVIEDVRTSKICRSLLTQSGRGMIIPVDHQFWKKYGFSPYHMNCRSSIRAIFKSQIGKDGIVTDNPSMKSLSKFKPQKGFGGNPIHKESWWRLTKEMAIRAAQFDIFNDIEKQARNNGLQNFAYNLVKGSDYFYEKISNYKIEGATLSRPEQKEILFAKLLEEKGNTWYFTPRLKDKMGVKNPDGIFNGHLADMKIMESKSLHRLAQRIKDADEQNVYSVCLNLTVKPNYTKNEAINFIKNEVLANKYKDVDTGLVIIKNIKEVCLSYENELIFIKNNNLK